ncbi:MAG: hypothetical protein CMF55_06650 [Legionellales bacterium]|nr:hypothetical protein [Legionellales bacterium]
MINTDIAILATGNEVVAGDIQNSNTRDIAQRLKDHNMPVVMHMAVNDVESEIVSALQYLKEHCSIIIITGGLGPTSDDRTRFALSALCDTDLVFDESSWKHIQQFFQSLGKPVSEVNRQQCYFPKDASVITNNNGTANACRFDWDGVTFFLLPGPPRECLPLVDRVVLPQLTEIGCVSSCVRVNYLLLGVGESDIANKIEPCFQACSDVELGYRASFPYIQVKLSASTQSALIAKQQLIEPLLAPYLVSNSGLTATEQLVTFIEQSSYNINMTDLVSYGRWQSHLATPGTVARLSFDNSRSSNCEVVLSGDDLMTLENPEELMYTLNCRFNGNTAMYEYRTRSKGIRVLDGVVEWASWKVLNFLKGDR